MPLDINVDIFTTNDCRTLVIEDKTGNYSEDNLGGWGNFNADPSILSLVINIQIYYQIEDGSIAMYASDYISGYDPDLPLIEFPISGSIKDFKFAIDIETLLKDFQFNSLENISIPQDLTELPDAMYQIGVSTYKMELESSNTFIFKNICLTSKLVSKALTSVNLQCEDCDDRDLDKVLLAKSLLESLENL
tara:strand:- start:1346 stop:1918 length:573 start_codon:yes stop_codon:yes gene_type:complete